VACKGPRKRSSLSLRDHEGMGSRVKRATYGDDWFKAAVARVILFRATEAIVSNAAWYEGGYRAQIVAYACFPARSVGIGSTRDGGLDFHKVWTQQSAGPVLERQIERSGKSWECAANSAMSGQNIPNGPTTVLPQDGPGGARDRGQRDLTIGLSAATNIAPTSVSRNQRGDRSWTDALKKS